MSKEAIGNLSRTKAIMQKYHLHAKKGFGQNFLTNPAVLNGIVDAAAISPTDNVIEIGPGLGALTEKLAQRAGQVLALELDTDLLPVLADVLSDYDNVTVLNQDVLKANLPLLIAEHFADPAKPVKVVANLPYYITSPILMHLLGTPVEWANITVMMQKEVAERLAAQPGTKDYGALTLAIEYKMDAKLAFTVSRRSFVPAPNVDSAIVTLTQRAQPLAVLPSSEKQLFALIKTCFAHRRKSLWNNLKPYFKKDAAKTAAVKQVLADLGLDPQIRPERLSLDQFIQLANALQAVGMFD